MGKRARKRERVWEGGGEQRMTKLPKESLEDSRRYEKEFVQICSGTKKKGKNASDVPVSAVKFTSTGSEVAQRDVYRTNRQFNSSSYFHTGGSSRLNFVS